MPLHLLPRALHYLETVARMGSVQAASRALGIAASAIDRQIIALEEACGAPLFERHPRGMRLTTAGESVILMARRWRADEDRLEAELREMRGLQHGTVRLAAMDSLANSILPVLIDKMAQDHPRIHLAIDIMTPKQAAQELDNGTIDLAIAFNLPNDRTRHVLWSAPLPFGCVVGAGHPLWGQTSIALKDAAQYPIAAQSRVLPSREYLDRRYGWLFDPVEPALVTNSLQLLKQVVRQGRLMAISSQLDTLAEIEAGTLSFIRLSDAALKPQSISVVVDARRMLPRAARLVGETLAEVVGARLARVTAPAA
ncbi:LysR family transcriptional regulator [Pararhodobacter zhoushanensis]|uniref:LysR family transcriptional regulator n=1 Tax=Pararhodobacter zhoushanensis TaxID=2479545 RepID=A0ABT3GZA7_9RHOB|nr:LysR family transcriptional regulator [Pararhodobacter zhoushanensis]MCW1932891.1 LysR family transcriptional regulator [Pararhodobacter zhoushanensis]